MSKSEELILFLISIKGAVESLKVFRWVCLCLWVCADCQTRMYIYEVIKGTMNIYKPHFAITVAMQWCEKAFCICIVVIG